MSNVTKKTNLLRKLDFTKIVIIIFLLIAGAFLKQKLWPFIPYDMYTEFNPNHRKLIYLELTKDDNSKIIVSLKDLVTYDTWPNDLTSALFFLKQEEPLRYLEILKGLKLRAIFKYGDVKSLKIFQKHQYLQDNKIIKSELEMIGEM